MRSPLLAALGLCILVFVEASRAQETPKPDEPPPPVCPPPEPDLPPDPQVSQPEPQPPADDLGVPPEMVEMLLMMDLLERFGDAIDAEDDDAAGAPPAQPEADPDG
jgi:hypothetical protein